MEIGGPKLQVIVSIESRAGGFSRAVSGPLVLVVMGVSGSGKTTVGSMLARRLGWPFQEGDDLHPQANIDKMQAGVTGRSE